MHPTQPHDSEGSLNVLDGIVLGGPDFRDTSFDYDVNVYYPILYAVSSELRQFTTKNVRFMKALQSCDPTSIHFLNTAHLLVDAYWINKLLSQLPLVKRSLAKKPMQDTSDAVIELAPLSPAFPAALQLSDFMIISVSTTKMLFCTKAYKLLPS